MPKNQYFKSQNVACKMPKILFKFSEMDPWSGWCIVRTMIGDVSNIWVISCQSLNTRPDNSFCDHLPSLAGILAFGTPGLGSYTMKATASYSYEGLVAAASDNSL